jgi:hypothetical protein
VPLDSIPPQQPFFLTQNRASAPRLFNIEQFRKWNSSKLGRSPKMANTMPNASHQPAADIHQLAPHTHRAAAAHHGKVDHQTGCEHSKQALEHADETFQS